jgi:hypothetical protein
MDGNKMDSIVIMDRKCILLVIIYNKTRGTYMKIEPWRNKTLNMYCNWKIKLKQ